MLMTTKKVNLRLIRRSRIYNFAVTSNHKSQIRLKMLRVTKRLSNIPRLLFGPKGEWQSGSIEDLEVKLHLAAIPIGAVIGGCSVPGHASLGLHMAGVVAGGCAGAVLGPVLYPVALIAVLTTN
jgi:hypothetical protein